MRKISFTPRKGSNKTGLDRLLHQLLKNPGPNTRARRFSRFDKTDVYKENGDLHYRMELPGFDRESIEVRVEDNGLLISAERRADGESERNYLQKGLKDRKVERKYPLPSGIDSADQLTAELNDGILHVQAPLPERDEGETVEVKID
ncbi:MAG: Hsp20/alpha crystallin family protein [Candidatus Acetothermia bacterium]